MKKLQNEEWRPILGFPKYEVSNLGRVRSLPNTVKYIDGRVFKYPGKVIKQYIERGYPSVTLRKENRSASCRKIHRLIALSFIPNCDPLNQNDVNHINGIKTDNQISNLEWVSHTRNVQHAFETGLMAKQQKGGKSPLSKSLHQFTIDGEFVQEWKGIQELRNSGFDGAQKAAKGVYQTICKGFRWSYNRELPDHLKPSYTVYIQSKHSKRAHLLQRGFDSPESARKFCEEYNEPLKSKPHVRTAFYEITKTAGERCKMHAGK